MFDYDLLMSHFPAKVYTKDENLAFLEVNEEFVTRHKQNDDDRDWWIIAESYKGKNDEFFFTSTHSERTADSESRIIESKKPIAEMLELETWRDPEKPLSWVLSSKYPYQYEPGKWGIIGISVNLPIMEPSTLLGSTDVEGPQRDQGSKWWAVSYYYTGPGTGKRTFNCASDWHALFGESPESASIMYRNPTTWLEKIHKDDVERYQAKVQAALQGKIRTYTIKFRYRNPDDGRYRWYAETAYRYNPDRTNSYPRNTVLIGSHRSIDYEHNVEFHTDLYKTILDNVSGFVFVKDSQRRFYYVNRKLLFALNRSGDHSRILGCTDREIALNIEDKETKEIRLRQCDEWEEADYSVLNENNSYSNNRETFINDEGDEIILHTTKVPCEIHDAETGISMPAILGIAINITDLRNQTVNDLGLWTIIDLINNLEDGVFLKDMSGRYRLINKFLANFAFQMTPDKVVGKTIDQLRPTMASEVKAEDDYIKDNKTKWEEVRRTGDQGPISSRLVTKIPIFRKGTADKPWEEKEVQYILGTSKDVSSSTAVLEALKQIVDTLPAYAFLKDLDGVFVKVNDAFAQRHKEPWEIRNGTEVPSDWGPKVIEGMTDKDFWSDNFAAAYRRTDQEAILKQEVILRTEHQYIGGLRHTINVCKVPTFDETGRVTGLMGFYKDLDEEQQRDATFFTVEGVADYIQDLRHDLVKPIQKAHNIISLLGTGTDISAQKQSLHNTVEYALLIADEIVELAAARHPESVPKDAITFPELRDELKAIAEEDAGALRFDVPSDQRAELVFYLPHTMTLRLINNLVGNGIVYGDINASVNVSFKFTVKDGGTGCLIVEVSSKGECLGDTISDVISLRNPSKHSKGAGHGLQFVEKSIELLGGTLSYHFMKIETRNVFTIRLPGVRYRLFEKDAMKIAEESFGRSIRNGSILIVDDDAKYRAFLQAELKGLSDDVVTVGNPSRALEFLQERSFDVIFTDFKLGEDINGHDFAIRARKLSRGECQIVLVSAIIRREFVDKLEEESEVGRVLNGFLSKFRVNHRNFSLELLKELVWTKLPEYTEDTVYSLCDLDGEKPLVSMESEYTQEKHEDGGLAEVLKSLNGLLRNMSEPVFIRSREVIEHMEHLEQPNEDGGGGDSGITESENERFFYAISISLDDGTLEAYCSLLETWLDLICRPTRSFIWYVEALAQNRISSCRSILIRLLEK